MNDLNSYSSLRFDISLEECRSWRAFAAGLRGSQSWKSDWFAAARRFFLSGGAKEFNPKWDDVDRIVDYATALESTLVPESDYNTRRVSRRAAALIAPDDPAQTDEVAKFIKENCGLLEVRVRQVLVTAVQKLPAVEDGRRLVLAGLYDPADEDRGSFAFEKFREIKSAEVRKAIAAKIAQLTRD